MTLKIVTISLLLVIITAEHVLYHSSELGFHVLHQQLFLVPLILASFWFGLRIGLIITIGICLLYGGPIVYQSKDASTHLMAMTQICFYLSISLLIGWLSDRKRRRQNKLFQNERSIALRKAASALIFIVQDIVKRIEGIQQQASKDENCSKNDEILFEINRLKKLLEALGQFSKPLYDFTMSHNLNELIKERLPTYQQYAAPKRIRVKTEFGKGGCPAMITTEAIPRVIDSLVDNAIDFSESGESIIIRLKREGAFCVLEVEDFGPGVSKEDEAKLFSVFFTTKSDGYGLSLSSGRKALCDLGGDLLYRSKEEGGAIFRMQIPSESPEVNIEEHVNAAVPLMQQSS